MVSVWNDTGRLRFYSRTPSSLHALSPWLLGGQTNGPLLTAPPRGHILCSWLRGFQKVSLAFAISLITYFWCKA